MSISNYQVCFSFVPEMQLVRCIKVGRKACFFCEDPFFYLALHWNAGSNDPILQNFNHFTRAQIEGAGSSCSSA